MYNPTTQVQALTDADLGSYYFKTKITVGASPTVFLSKKEKKKQGSLVNVHIKTNHLHSSAAINVINFCH